MAPTVRTPTVRTCPTPGHAHPQYREPRRSDSRYVVRSWANWEDVELRRPARVLYCSTRGEAENHRAQSDMAIVDVRELD